MKRNRTFLSLLLIFTLIVLSLTACQFGQDASTTEASSTEAPAKDPVTVRIGGLKGPTSIGMAKIMKDSHMGNASQDYAFTIAGSADELTPMLIQGKLDMAAVPANLAAVLYQKTQGKVMVLAINTLGVQYIVQKNGTPIESVADLKGKTIYATGKGTVNEFVMQYLFAQNGLSADDVKIEWKSEPTEVVAQLKTSGEGVAMLPQPYVTIAQTQVSELKVALSFEEEWGKLDTDSKLITGVMVVRKAFVEEHPEAVQSFMQEYATSTAYVNEHPEEAAAWVTEFLGIPTPVATKAIPNCNISLIGGEEMKTALSAYLSVLYGINPNATGGALPQNDFYYLP